MARVRAGVVQQKCHVLLEILSLPFLNSKGLSPPAQLAKILRKFSKEILEISLHAEILWKI